MIFLCLLGTIPLCVYRDVGTGVYVYSCHQSREVGLLLSSWVNTREAGHREVRYFVQGHTAVGYKGWD